MSMNPKEISVDSATINQANPTQAIKKDAAFEGEALKEAADLLAKTSDALAPMLAMTGDVRKTKFIAAFSIRLNFVLSIALVCLAGLCLFFGYKAVNIQREYFATEDGRLTPIVPLSTPYIPCYC